MAVDILKALEAAGLQAYKPAETREVAPIKVLIYGEPGSGKTALAGTFPNCLLLDVDGGAQTTLDSDYARTLGLHERTHYIRVGSVADIKKAIGIIRKDKGRTFQSLAIDSISVLSMNTVSDLTASSTAEDDDEGGDRYMEQRDWGLLLLALYRVMKEAVGLGLHICVTAHVAEREDTDGKEKKMPLLQGQFKDMSLAFFDAIGYMYTVYAKDPQQESVKGEPQQKIVHRVQFVPTTKVKAKDRTGRLGKYIDNITFEHLRKALHDREGVGVQGADATLYDDEEHIATILKKAVDVPTVEESKPKLTREEKIASRERREAIQPKV